MTRRRGAPVPAREEPSRARVLLAGLLVFAAGVAVFLPTLRYSFLNWDDPVYVLQNPWIRGLTARNLEAIFTRPYFQNYLPLHLLSYAADFAVWKLNPLGYHLGSVLLHGLNVALAFAVVKRLGRSLWIALVAALLFAVHPSHVEAVAWVSSLKEFLSTTFLLLALLFYLHARRGQALRPLPYALSVLSFTAAMLSKVSVVVLPAFLLLVDAMPEGKGRRPPLLRALLEKIPYGVAGAALILVNSRAQVTARAAYAHEALRYFSVKGHAVWNYLGVLLGLGGNPDYDLPHIEGPGVILALAGWLVLPAAGLWLWRRKRRLEVLGVAWIFLTLLPALLFPLVTYMADRYLYAPSLGFCWAVAAAVVSLGEARSAARPVAALATAALLAFFTARTLQESRRWRDSETLWTYAITRSRDFRVYNNLAQVRMEQKRWSEAERLLREGALVENVISWQSLGVLHYETGRFPEALAETDRAIAIAVSRSSDPGPMSELHYNRGAILLQMGRTAEAAEEWRTALRLNPDHVQARQWLERVSPGSKEPVRAAR